MEIISISSEAFGMFVSKIQQFRGRVLALCHRHRARRMGDWLDNQDVCLLLNISPRTLQSYRDSGRIGFSRINHKIYYKLSDVQGLLQPDGSRNENNKNDKSK
ncbi:helix-turn-helix domain-containing protein [Dysgonomonas sp.]